MANRLVIGSIMVVSLVFFMGTKAWATISGTSTTQTGCTTKLRNAGLCSIQVEGLLKGLGNVTKTPTAFAVTILIQEGKIFCKNPAGNSLEGNGVPFSETTVTLEGADAVNAADVSKNGRALSDIVFHDPQLIQALIDSGAVTAEEMECQHSNWIQIILVKKLQVLGEQFTDPTEPTTCDLNSDPLIIDNSCTLVDALGTECTSPVVADDKSLVWQQFTYACTELCHNATGTTCPASPPIP